MADSYYDIARELRGKPGVRLATKGSQWDRVYVEQETLPKVASSPTFPADANSTWRDGSKEGSRSCTPGGRHPKCKYLILVDAYYTGGDDDKQNWSFTYKLDIRAFWAAFPSISTSWEALLAKDGIIYQFPAQDDSPEVTWTFTIVNPDSYVRAAQGTVHPLIANCFLISEQYQRDGQTLTVTRVYHKVAPLDAQAKIGFTVTAEYKDFHIITWSYEVANAGYIAPDASTTCPIAGFTSLKVIKPPDRLPLNTENTRVTITYGALPGPEIIVGGTSEGPAGNVARHSQRRATANGDQDGPWLDYQTTEQNGFSKVWNWVTLTTTPAFHDFSFDPDGRDRIETIRQIVLASSTPTQALGEDVTQSQINPYYASRTTRSYDTGTGRPTAYTRLSWINFSTPDIITGITGTSGDDGNTWITNYLRRSGFNKKLKGKVVTEFFDAQPSPQTLLQIIPSGQAYSGVHFDVSTRGSLVDAIPGFGSSGGSYVETVDIAPSVPTATEYLDLVDDGDYQAISEETARMWSGHYMRRTYFVILE